MEIDLEHHDDVCILRITGRLAPGADEETLSEKASEIKQQRCARLLGDFREVPWIGSMGIGFVVGLHAALREVPGGRFVLVGASPKVRHVLDITRVSTIILLADDLDSGLAALRE